MHDARTLHRLLWRFTAWLMWHQSKTLRDDYYDKRDQAWAQGMTMMDRAEWIGRRNGTAGTAHSGNDTGRHHRRRYCHQRGRKGSQAPMTMTAWTHNEHTYIFERNRGVVSVKRDDGCHPWSTYPSVSRNNAGDMVNTYAVHKPALATITEAKHLIMHGHTNHGTYVHQVVWARTADDARRMREEADANGTHR